MTNRVPCFQREANDLVKEKGLRAMFAYLDNVTVVGASETELERNQTIFLDAAHKKNYR